MATNVKICNYQIKEHSRRWNKCLTKNVLNTARMCNNEIFYWGWGWRIEKDILQS